MKFDERIFFQKATLKICSSLEIERSLHLCLTYIQDFIPAGQMSFHVYHRKEGIVETVAHATFDGGHTLSLKSRLSQKGRRQVENQRSVRVRKISRLGDDPVTGPVVKHLNASDLSGVVIDLVLENKMLGVLSVFDNGIQAFTTEHVRLLSLLRKPCAIALTNSLRYRELMNLKEILTDDNRYFQNELNKISGQNVIGVRNGLKEVMQMVHQVAHLESSVLLLGETGTGKEVIANTIHQLSSRKDGPFIRVNCGAIPASLLDSELFGHEKGAFTGSISQKRGRIERAQGGTLFLDEVGELSAEAQIRLLRVLQEKEIERVGGSDTIRVNIRVIAATHRNLDTMMKENKFRADLFFRLRVFPITIPPLRERIKDIPDLVNHFVQKKCKEMKRISIPTASPDVRDRLQAYQWPGNVRELENAVERSLILDQGRYLYFKEIGTAQAIQPGSNTSYVSPATSTNRELNTVISEHIRNVLMECNGRIEGEKGVAKVLNINPSTLRQRMRKLKIPFGTKTYKRQN